MNSTTAGTTADVQQELENAKQAVLDAYANFLEAKKHLQRAAMAAGVEIKESATEQLDEAIAKARDRTTDLHDSTSAYVRENPLTSAGLAFLGGLIVSRLLGK